MVTRLPGGIFDAQDKRLSQYSPLKSRLWQPHEHGIKQYVLGAGSWLCSSMLSRMLGRGAPSDIPLLRGGGKKICRLCREGISSCLR